MKNSLTIHNHPDNTFTAYLAEIKTHLTTLQQAAENHFGYDPDHINWGHVGTIAHINTQLKEIIDPK